VEGFENYTANRIHQEKVLHVDMGFFPNIMLGKKSHVDMGKSHVNMGFFPNIMFGKKSHVGFDMQKLHVNLVQPCAGGGNTWIHWASE